MDMNSALVPYLLSHASNTVPARPSDMTLSQDAALRPVSGGPASGNIAFYFRNWPFPVDLPEPSGRNAEMRSWHERLASYREAIRSAARDNAAADAADQTDENDRAAASPVSSPTAGTETQPPPPRSEAGSDPIARNTDAMPDGPLTRPDGSPGPAPIGDPA